MCVALLYTQKSAPEGSSNIDALVGRHGFVIVAITPMRPGSVKIGGQLWMAVSAHQEDIPANTVIEIVYVRGAHLAVKPVAQ